MKVYILGIKIDDIKMDQAIQKVDVWLRGSGSHQIVTTNPEFVMTAQTDLVFRKILNDADLSIPDGVGLKLSGKIKNTIPGVDLMEKLCELAVEKDATVGFLGGRDGVAEKSSECLGKKYPGLKVSFVDKGQSLGIVSSSKSLHSEDAHNVVAPSRIPQTDILFVAFGHPKQEKWIAEDLNKLNVKVAMGVGGAFDYISGKVPRAPIFIRNLGLEWLFRLIIQPWRIKRQIKLLKYTWLVLNSK